MSSLLEVPAIRRQAFAVPVELYHRMTEGRPTELLRGVIIEKRSKSPLHHATSEDLRAILSTQIQPGYLLRQEGPLTLSESEPEPDLSIVRGSRGEFRVAHPATAELVIEVALSSLEIDRVKALIYAEAGVAEYWIVRPDQRQIEVSREPSPQGYAVSFVVGTPARLECQAVPGLYVVLSELFP